MKIETPERKLIQKMIRIGTSEDTMAEVLSVLDTEENCRKMIAEVERLINPSREVLLFTAFLIAHPE